MRFRGRVAIGKGEDKKPNAKYFLDIPTCRPLGAATKTSAAKTPRTLANALFLVKGSKDFGEAEDKLRAAGSDKAMLLALFQANLDGKMNYPI